MDEGVNLLANNEDGINLFADQIPTKSIGKQKSFYDLSKEDQTKALGLARQQISAQYPNMPNWLRDMMLSITPRDESPRLQGIANQLEQTTRPIPVIAGGLLQGASIPIRGAASLIPTQFTKDLANSPDLSTLFSAPRGAAEENARTLAEVGGSVGPLGGLFGALKGGAQLARVPKFLQNALSLSGTAAIATPGDMGDRALSAVGALALGGAGKIGSSVVSKVPPFLRGLTNSSTVNNLVESIQKPHDILSNTADQLYDYVREAIKKRNVKINMNPKTLDEILEYPSMQSKTHKELVQQAKKGDYEALHKLQSSLYKKGSKDVLNEDSVIETRGENTLDLRDRINKELQNDLIKQGHIDISHTLNQGKNVYKKIMDTYFNKNLREAGGTAIGKLVHKDLRIVPKNPTTLLDTNSKPMNEFLKQHPEAAKYAQDIKEKDYAKKALRNIFIGSGLAGGTSAGIKTFYDFLK